MNNIMLDKELDTIYETIDELMLGGDFTQVDRILDEVDVATTPIVLCLGYLTVCHVARHRLKNYKGLFNKIKYRAITERDATYANRLLDGLYYGEPEPLDVYSEYYR